MDINLINPYIRVCMQSTLPAHHFIRQRIIFDYELLYLEKGTLLLNYNGQDYLCRPGQLLLLRPGISHSLRCLSEEVSQPHIHFDLQWEPNSAQVPVCFRDRSELSSAELRLLRTDAFSRYPQTPLLHIADMQAFLSLFRAITASPPQVDPLRKKILLLQLIQIFVQDNYPGFFTAEEPTGYDIARQVKDYIDAGQGLTMGLPELEKQFAYSRYYLEKRFRQLFGTSLIAYRNERRLQLAVQLLQTKNITATAEALGYSSIITFSRAFRNRYGVSPSAFRPEHK